MLFRSGSLFYRIADQHRLSPEDRDHSGRRRVFDPNARLVQSESESAFTLLVSILQKLYPSWQTQKTQDGLRQGLRPMRNLQFREQFIFKLTYFGDPTLFKPRPFNVEISNSWMKSTAPKTCALRGYVELPPMISWSRCLRSAEGLADAFFGTGWGRVTVEIGPVVVGT